MMNNLFSMFDPSTSTMSMMWGTMGLPLIMIMNSTKKSNSKIKKSTNSLKLMIMLEVNQITSTVKKKGMSNTMTSMFLVTLTLNSIAIMPFNYTITAHISITMSMSLTMWMASMINSIKNSTKVTIIHLTPLGTPNPLMNFMVLIETISQMIRPLTLAIRLMANMVAGHLLLNLLSNFSLSSKEMSMASMMPLEILLMLETAVAMIQAYVISILLTLYYKESF